MPVKYPLARRKVNRFETAARRGIAGRFVLCENTARRLKGMKITEIERARRAPDAVDRLTAVWESSVRATHDFLSGAEISEIKKYVPDALANVPRLFVAADETGQTAAFMGSDGRKIEMLFVAPEYRGKGFGKKLVNFAFDVCAVDEVTVNEQNPRARGFYERMGFRAVSRSAVDGQGNPYPVLRMRVQKNRENEI